MRLFGGLVTRQGRRFLASTSLVAVGLVLGAEAGQASSGNADNITFCHATHSVSNPYVVITTDPAGIIKAGHGDHSGPVFNPEGGRQQPTWGDVIPAFDYSKSGKTPAGHFAGLNLPAGQSLLDGSCQFPRSAGTGSPLPELEFGMRSALAEDGAALPILATTSLQASALPRAQIPRAQIPRAQIPRATVSPALAFTGFEAVPLALSGVILLGFGAVLTAVGRRSVRK